MDTPTLVAMAALIMTIISIPIMIWSGRHSVRYAMKLSNQPIPSPVENQPKNLIQRVEAWLFGLAKNPRTDIVLIFANIINLLFQLFDPSPFTKWSVLYISFSVSSVFFFMHELSLFAVKGRIEKLEKK
jgi:hypothetical protein